VEWLPQETDLLSVPARAVLQISAAAEISDIGCYLVYLSLNCFKAPQ
jgi:hypothetical protein